ncbi:MAG: hypothetical protein EA388_01940 [Nitriliruptor sp.]|nr:MAG: hypothetical protein EA388_01940 [Nitriliruptor sp.]
MTDSDRPGSSGPFDPFDWVRELVLADLDAGDVPSRLLLAEDGQGTEPGVQIVARPESPHDDASPLSEMACAIAARPPRRAVWVVPGRLRDLADERAAPLGRCLVLTCLDRRPGGWQLHTRTIPFHPDGNGLLLGAASDVEVELSPVASLMDDAARLAAGHDLQRTLAVLSVWGHTVATTETMTGRSFGATLPAPTGSDRHRVRRIADEFEARHTPAAPAASIRRRPAIPTGIPDGWSPACPL